MWLWAAALGATLAGLVVVLRALGRVDAAVAALRISTVATAPVAGAGAALDRATEVTARQRGSLARSADATSS